MPWKIIKPMDQKIKIIRAYEDKKQNISELSLEYGISRKTVYKWINRYKTYGAQGLEEQSRAPKHSPNETKVELVEQIVREKLKYRKRGPKKLYYQLKKRNPEVQWPQPSTIGCWLKKRGLVEQRYLRKKVPPYSDPFIEVESANDTWSADYKGQFKTRDQQVCYPLTISDNYSRYLIRCTGLLGPKYDPTQKVFKEAFMEYGLPRAIRSDNGFPFAGNSVGGLSRLSIWWIKLGIIPERIEKGCPQQNGRHERMHRTLKLETVDPSIKNIKEQQKQFDWFTYNYNHERPHESLGNDCPAEYYTKSSRPYVEKIPPIHYDSGCTVRQVRTNGYFRFNGSMYFLTDLLYSEPIALKEIDDGLWKIFFSFYPIAMLDLRQNKVLKLGQFQTKT